MTCLCLLQVYNTVCCSYKVSWEIQWTW